MAKIITIGEIMLRLSTPHQQRFVQTSAYDVTYGGGEANVAASLARFGHHAVFVSKLPAHEIGQAALDHLARYQVDTTAIARGGDRLGIYFLETGASMRPSKVIYDRSGSALATARPEDFDFETIFKDADWFHWSGITPALGEHATHVVTLALEHAKKHGVTVSVDLNYRKKLWTSKKAQAVMRPLMRHVDVCIGNEEDAELVLGHKPKQTDVTQGKLDLDSYQDIFKNMQEAFGFRFIATTLRESYSATHNGWRAMLYDGKTYHVSNRYDIDPIIDRVGGGDAFSAGLIHGLITSDPAAALEFATAASALKHTIHGDFNLVSAEEVEALVKGDRSGRVRR